MNKKGQLIIFYIMIAVIILIIAMSFAPVVRTEIDRARNHTLLNESNLDNTVVNRATSKVLDVGFFYLIASAIAVGLALLTGKKTITGVLTSVFVTIVVILLIMPLKTIIITFRSAAYLNCAGTITTGTSLACLFIDLWLFYFVVMAIASSIAFITLKKVDL